MRDVLTSLTVWPSQAMGGLADSTPRVQRLQVRYRRAVVSCFTVSSLSSLFPSEVHVHLGPPDLQFVVDKKQHVTLVQLARRAPFRACDKSPHADACDM